LVHAWDLQRAIGADHKFDEVMYQTSYHETRGSRSNRSGSEHYADEVPVPESAPWSDRLAALLGRDPMWVAR
jgi:hypothetical protein